MRATILQVNTIWGKPSENQTHAEEMIKQAPRSDLYILPEMWNTGFAAAPFGIAERLEECQKSGSLKWMIDMARKYDAAICGSLSIETGNTEYANRCFFVRPDGSHSFYDKRHLFFGGGENVNYTAGNKRTLIEYHGLRFMLLVCYDLRFPVWARNHEDYDAIICVANWPETRQEAWETLLKARAIENQCYVLGANRVGKDGSCKYSGGSCIVSAYGKQLSLCGNAEGFATAELDIESLKNFRKAFPVLSDRDCANL